MEILLNKLEQSPQILERNHDLIKKIKRYVKIGHQLNELPHAHEL